MLPYLLRQLVEVHALAVARFEVRGLAGPSRGVRRRRRRVRRRVRRQGRLDRPLRLPPLQRLSDCPLIRLEAMQRAVEEVFDDVLPRLALLSALDAWQFREDSNAS